ncbi:MAG: hypothetical protein NDP24_05595 [Crenarchaeota archaeon]|nr:hypothetical protein [Thermoproteota archaeon]
MKKFDASDLIRKPDLKAVLALLVIFAFAMTFTVYNLYAQSIQEEVPINYRITAPYNPPPRPHKDGEVIVGRRYFTVRLYVILSKNITSMEAYLDVTGECIYPEGANATFEPYLSGGVPRVSAYKVSLDGKSEEVNVSASLITLEGRKYIYITLPGRLAGEAYDLYWQLVPPSEIPEGIDKYMIGLEVKFTLYYPDGTSEWLEIPPKIINIIRPPVMNYIIVATLAAAGFGLIILAGFMGFFRLFSTLDLIIIAIISAMQVIWVHVIGRLLVFPVLNRIPLTYNFAVGDFPYILLLILAVMLIRKPGTVSLTLFVYNLASQIMGFYSFDPVWWAYPIAEGIVPDVWILLRGEAVLTDKVVFLKRHVSAEKLELAPKFGPLKYIDGFIIGFARGFTMQYTLYVVFFPYLYRLSYSMGYVFWWLVIPWSIGNAIEAVISVPMCENIRKSAATI